jgi:hypothetical protein
MKSYEKRIEATYLSKCTPQAAYDWLFERRIKDVYGYCESHDATLEYILLRRNEPLIDLAIAKFGHSNNGIETVFLRGNSGVRCAALSNPHIGYIRGCNFHDRYGSSIVITAALHGTKAEQESLTKNINLKGKVIEDLLSRKGLFENKSDDEYIRLLGWLGENPRMKTTFDETGQRLDGPSSYSHDHVFFMAWELAETLPATQKFAHALYKLLFGTAKVSATTFKDFPSVMERWRIEDDTESGKPTYSESYFLRRRLADLINPDDKLLNSDDFAERESFYRRFSPLSYTEWPSFIEKDGKGAFDGLVYNDNLWMDEKTRRLLSDIAWKKVPDPNHSLNAVNTFLAVEKYNREKHPDWFLDEDLGWGNSTESIDNRLEEKLGNLSKVIDSLEQSFKDSDSFIRINFDRFKEEIKETKQSNSNSVDTISAKINSLDSLLDSILESINSNKQILWFIVALILFFILKNFSKVF